MSFNIMFRIVAMLSIIFGTVLYTSLNVNTIGAVIGTSKISDSITIGFATFFVVMGLALLVTNISAKRKQN